MRNHILNSFCIICTVVISSCQSAENNAETTPTIISNTLVEATEPLILSLPGVASCGAIVKSNIEVIYTGRWLEPNGEEALPHTLVVMKPVGISSTVYYASDVWKPWGRNKPQCKLKNVARDGNSILVSEASRDGKGLARYQLNGETATGKYEYKKKAWPITMTRYWADGVDELNGF